MEKKQVKPCSIHIFIYAQSLSQELLEENKAQRKEQKKIWQMKLLNIELVFSKVLIDFKYFSMLSIFIETN